METTVMYVGWATVIGVLVLACGWVWYYVLFWWFNAIKNTYAMVKFVRLYVISTHRKRRRDKERYLREVLLSNAQFNAGDSTHTSRGTPVIPQPRGGRRGQ